VDAVTVTTNDGADLDRLLSCPELRNAFDRLIVVDNQSTDGSADMARHAGAEVISLSHRRGYGGCVNAGARRTTGPLFAVLNPDITFDGPDVVARLERHFDQPRIGLVAPALVLPDGRRQDSARHIPTPVDLLLRRRLCPERGAIHASGEVPWVVGACFIVRRDVWEALGGFDERYFLYFDDVDICWRMRKAGFSTMLDGGVCVHHRYGRASRKNLFGFAMRQHIRSATRFYVRNPRFVFSRRLPPQRAPAGPAFEEASFAQRNGSSSTMSRSLGAVTSRCDGINSSDDSGQSIPTSGSR
jgi:N-acetylglucosaminyl-diphospho-decaprenol L-rhamnosyltransferase